ncbi:MAG TPA: GNAT family N-acetyltransferase [Rubrobacteraceae bacterium]|nr:GNAT family N-acetyltransferase [Rubrobacteraceae bacterium]
MSEQTKTILALETHQLHQAAEVLSQAFHNDPFLKYSIRDEDKRTRLLPSLFGALIRYALLYGEAYTTPALEGVALWLPPGNTRTTFIRMLRTGLLTMPLKYGWAGFRRFLGVVTYIEGLQEQLVAEPHWYLGVLGVGPLHQRRGIGGALIQPLLRQADAGDLPCYLETYLEIDVSFYQKHGFKVTHDGKVPNHGLQFWAMVRDPIDKNRQTQSIRYATREPIE